MFRKLLGVPLLLLVCFSRAEKPENEDGIADVEAPIFEDKLDDKYGQCPIPHICFTSDGLGCSNNRTDDVTVVNCTHRYAGPYVPQFSYYIISPRTWDFDFSYNGISTIASDAFYTATAFESVPINFTSLRLAHNYIDYISPKAFKGFVTKQLRLLDLSYNRLIKLEDGVFDDMSALETLDLSNNLLLNIDNLCRAPLPQVDLLELSENRLSYLPDNCFSNSRLSSRGSLSLDNNFLGTVPDCSYRSIKATVSVVSNPLLCDSCSPKFSQMPCMLMQNNVSTKSNFSQCYSSVGTDCNYLPVISLTYKDRSTDYITVAVSVNSTTSSMFDIKLYQYVHLGTETVSATNNQTVKGVDKAELQVLYGFNYTVCATSESVKELTQCQFVVFPRYQPVSDSSVCRAFPWFSMILFVVASKVY